ncbi:Protein pyrABCN [Cladobotryum mycophilum]|uniref:Protein pyrABCN n=1 Tax=Cladobotryum mycophilum TaxID=491253 RepID=A0ABR0T309_9HYPO
MAVELLQPAAARIVSPGSDERLVCLELEDGATYQGYSFGAEKSIAGELVFQTGMVGYPESITDPSYRGQILVITFPLVGNYGVPSRETLDELLGDLPAHFESSQIHIAGLVTASYCGEDFSHFLATSSLGTWLKEQGVPAMYGVDTRALTKKIRQKGSMLGKMRLDQSTVANGSDSQANGLVKYGRGHTSIDSFEAIDWLNPNEQNLVAQVSIKEPKLYKPPPSVARKHPSGRTIRVLCVDVGMKYNQLRCFLKRGVEVVVCPWDHDLAKAAGEEYDGLFISNGPGDPAMLDSTVKNIAAVMEKNNIPIFGICLGHQLMARASGAKTAKMKFGNRGHNIPCTSMVTGKCHITSQNHGFAVDSSTLPAGWKELFVNANDGSNEGIMHTEKPYFSVQFHPESTPGPRDTEFLFDVFIDTMASCAESPALLQAPVSFPGGTIEENERLHPRVSVKKVLVLGSGGLSIGQAGEFDYSGSQAIKALKEEGIYTVLINPNIATIQTSKGLADKVYFLPVNAEFVRKVIQYERPDAIYVTFGGQTALQVGIQLKDEFEALGVKVLGTPIDTIITTEDRELFARSMDSIGEKCAKSASASNVDEALHVVKDIGFPVIVRAAYALGGLGSGFANNEQELLDLCNKAFAASPQVLIERSMKGWKEIEYEVVRDCQDNCITVCNMENFDPLGIHTGDSIVVAPSQTLSDEDYNMLRTTAVNVIRHLGVVGECNIQYALNPFSREYCIIEVNARLSRSSALASKATGYPLAFIAAKLGLGIPLKEISNSVTKVTCACFEPSLDYVVVKMPRWDLKKFTRVSTQLGSSMKSVGEVMSIGRSFEEAIQKAIRAIDFHNLGFGETKALMSIDDELQTPSDQRLFAIANAMHEGYSVDKIWEMTRIDKWFLRKLQGLSDFAKQMSHYSTADIARAPGVFLQAKRLGFSDRQLAKFWSSNEIAVRRMRLDAGIKPYVKQIDTVAAEFPAFTNYLYLTYNASENDIDFNDNGVMVLGSGVYRIGSSVEFDWCSVRAIRTLRASGFKTIMVNYNPETVSTDYDEADKLYFENINLETILDIYELESASGVLGAMGGQTPNNIALPLHRAGVKVLGTSPEMIDTAENRYKFSRMLDRIEVDQPTWKELTSFEEAQAFCQKVSYPVLVRPSYVLSGAAMNTVYSEKDLESYLAQAVEVSREHPVVITKYIENAKEIEMDAVAKDGIVVGHFISEHVENAGVHSGDATLILPPQDLEPTTIQRIEEATRKIGAALNVTGPFNIQFIAKDNDIKVIECNVRASRSFPFVSKVMGVDLIEMATKAIMGQPFQEYPPTDLAPECVGVKVPQFSFSRLSGADPVLGVEMASTGEVACFGIDKNEAYLKALLSTGFKIPKKNILLSIGSYKDKKEMLPSIEKLQKIGYKLFATAGTADFLQEHGVPVQFLEVLGKEEDKSSEFSLTQHLAKNTIDLYINLPSNNKYRRPANYMSKGYQTRRMAVDYQIPLVTNVKNAKILIEAIARHFTLGVSKRDYQTSHKTVVLPGLVNVAAFIPGLVSPNSQDMETVTKASISSGFSMVRVMPLGLEGAITDGITLRAAQQNSKIGDYCDYNFSVSATSDNESQISGLAGEVGSLFIPFNHLSGNISKVAAVTAHFDSWPTHKVIVTDAKLTDLASILLLASLHNRRIHVTSVTNKDDIRLIALSKAKGLQVTCDVSIYALYLSTKDLPECGRLLPTPRDQAALWEYMSTIDVFSVGSLPYQLATSLGHKVDASFGIADALPLLLTSVAEGKLTIDDLKTKLYQNPVDIFELHEQTGTSVEVEVDRAYEVTPTVVWSPFEGRKMRGSVRRVIFQDTTVCLDGEVLSVLPKGKDMSSHSIAREAPMSPALKPALNSISHIVESPKLRQQAAFHSPMTSHRFHDALASPARLGGAVDELGLPLQLQPASRSSIQQLLSQPSSFRKSHVLSVKSISRADLHLLFTVAQEMRLGVQREGVLDILRGRLLCTMFYEPSTRTSASFDAAMQRLGGRTIAISTSTSSVQKGETLQDTLRTLACYGDAVVLRHPDEKSVDIAAKYSPVPVINGGNGSKEHPTQAFLDLYTIREELGTVQGLTITFIGDLLYGRPVHSLVYLLQHYQVKVQLVSPKGLGLPAKVREQLVAAGQLLSESETLTPEILAQSDVLYCTRVQKERFESEAAYEAVRSSYRIDNATLKNAKSSMVVMHPLPRNEEIAEEVDFDQRAAYFRQMRYGLYCRMALLALVMAIAPAGHNPHGQADQFTLSSLSRSSLHPSSPIPQFHAWFSQAQSTPSIAQPEACTLSTAELPSGRVSARMVYLKELDTREGFVVYTNLGTSRKAADLASNPHASLVFYWGALQRQVRVEGVTERNTREESQNYFDTRVRGSRIGAWASRQSQVLRPHNGDGDADGKDDGRRQLEGWVAETEKRFEGEERIPVPEFWGGLRIIPRRVEFWQGRDSRLHDRFVYEWEGGEGEEAKWKLERLSP